MVKVNKRTSLVSVVLECCYILCQLRWSCTGFLSVSELNSSLHVYCLVHQLLAEQTLEYQASNIPLIADIGCPQIWSTSERICVVPRTHNSFGNRSFSAAGPRVWNALPSYLQQDMNYRHFKQSLKGHMFRLQLTMAHCDCCFRAPYKPTYLLTYCHLLSLLLPVLFL